MSRKAIIAIVGCLVITAAVIGAYLVMRPITAPDPASQDKDQKVKFIASKEFSKLPEKEKSDYLNKIADARVEEGRGGGLWQEASKLPEDDRKVFFENMRPMFELRMNKRVQEYCALSEEKREEYLDKMIDQFMERREEREARGGQDGGGWRGGGPDGGRGGGPSVQRVKDRISGTDPATRAKAAAFFRDLRARMQTRGITPPHHQ